MNKAGYVKLLILSALCYSYLGSAAGVFGLAQGRLTPGPEATGATAEAKELFAQRCARCHGMDGRGETTIGKMVGAPNLAGAEWWRKLDDEARLAESVKSGRNRMPAFGQRLTEEQIASLVRIVRGFKPEAKQIVQPAASERTR